MNKEYDIWIVDSNRKKDILNEIRKDNLFLVKVFTIDEFRKKYYFDYDDRAIYYLMKEKGYQYDIALMYLSHMIEICDDISFSKVDFLSSLKNELDREKLLKYCSFFKSYLKGKKILVYQINNISKFDKRMFDSVSKDSYLEYSSFNYNNYSHESIICCDSLDDEVSFVASSICNLISNGVDISNIKVLASSVYYSCIDRIFSWFNIPIKTSNSSLFNTSMGQFFLSNLDVNKEEALRLLKEKYSSIDIYNKIISILNKYTWCDNLEELECFLVRDFKRVLVDDSIDRNTVSIISSLDGIKDDTYVFLMGFNQGEVPYIYKDEDYFNDEEKKLLGLDTTDELNSSSYREWINNILNTKNIIISMKKNDSIGECYLSSLNDELMYELVDFKDSYLYSNLYNKIKLSMKLDYLVKYNELEIDTELLYKHYPDLLYMSYDNKFSSLSKEILDNYYKKGVILSYSSINNYYLCSFKYYLNSILKIGNKGDDFNLIIGNLFHYILSLVFIKDIDIHSLYWDYINKLDYVFNARENYFLEKLENDLMFVIDSIKLQNDSIKLDNMLCEESISIDKKYEDMDVIFKGFVDKILFDDNNNMAIIDYKTGNPNLDLNRVIYGLDMQLPVYIYLIKNKYPSARIVGIYLQKILNTEIVKDYKNTYLDLKKDKLRLQGYTNSNGEVSSLIDSYCIKGSKVLSDDMINKLTLIVDKNIDSAIKDIYEGKFNINPKRIDNVLVGCEYCQFKDICFKTEKDIVNLKGYKNMEFLGGDDDDTNEAQ